MKRRKIQVVKSRMEDIEVGDVVNRSPGAEKGWFEVVTVSTLFDGDLQLADESELVTIAAGSKDLVGVQIMEEITVDSATGLLVPDQPVAPMMVAAPGTVPAPAPAAGSAPAPARRGERGKESSASSSEEEVVLPAIVAEAAPAPGASAVNLAVVADLLSGLDLGEDPPLPLDAQTRQIKSNRRRDDVELTPVVPLPPGARPVERDVASDTPSYKNPVVVDESEAPPLPKRGRVIA